MELCGLRRSSETHSFGDEALAVVRTERVAILQEARPMRMSTSIVGALLLCGLFYAGLPFAFGFGLGDWRIGPKRG